MPNTALIVGASGIVGNNLARRLRGQGWNVHGLARRPPDRHRGRAAGGGGPARPGALLAARCRALRPTHVFISTWMRQATEAENIGVNGAMVRNLLEALPAQVAACSMWRW